MRSSIAVEAGPGGVVTSCTTSETRMLLALWTYGGLAAGTTVVRLNQLFCAAKKWRGSPRWKPVPEPSAQPARYHVGPPKLTQLPLSCRPPPVMKGSAALTAMVLNCPAMIPWLRLRQWVRGVGARTERRSCAVDRPPSFPTQTRRRSKRSKSAAWLSACWLWSPTS